MTTDFRTILARQASLEEIIFKSHGYQGKLWPEVRGGQVVKKLRIKARSPLQFLEEYLLPLPMLIRTLYGSWTDPDEFVAQTGRVLLALLRKRS